jgi:hypothetical protein
MTNCDFIARDLESAGTLFGSFTLVYTECTLVSANTASGVGQDGTETPRGVLLFSPYGR